MSDAHTDARPAPGARELHARFDALSIDDLRGRECAKWRSYPDDVLPLWVADMDLPIAEPIRAALRAHVASDNFGYPASAGLPGLREAAAERLERRYGWSVAPEAVLPIPGIVPGLFLGVRALTSAGEGVVVQPPVYPPFLSAVERQDRRLVHNPLREGPDGYRVDLEGLAAAVTPSTRLLLLCNPHNPTGRAFTRAELEGIAEVALRHRLWIVSDELHADLTLDGEHVPIASLSPEVAERTLTLYGPTKAFNIAGLKVGFAIATDPSLRERFSEMQYGTTPPPNVLAQAGAIAALRDADDWLDATLAYLRANRDLVAGFVAERLPGVRMHAPEATYLAWLDFREALPESELAGLLESAKVALNLGPAYGPGGTGFARLNFATGRAVVAEGLERIEAALRGRGRG